MFHELKRYVQCYSIFADLDQFWTILADFGNFWKVVKIDKI